MNWRAILFLLLLLAPGRLLANTGIITSTDPNALCRNAIAAAERAHGIPTHLLAAIARVESGRRDQVSGTFNPWPWTINTDGQGSFYDNKAQAVAAAMSMRPHVTTLMDVGCMQISLTYHPDAFPDLNQAFNPASNADYGARYLQQLYQKSGSWPRAVELYYSATPEIGQEYGRRVYAGLPEEQKLATLDAPIMPFGSPSGSLPSGSLPSGSAPSGSLFGGTFHPSMFALPRPGAPRMLPVGPGLAQGAPVGRSLAAYRAAPVRFAFHTPS